MVTGRFVLDDRGKAVRFLRRTALLYAACIVIYLPLNIYNGELPGLRELLLDGTLYHLWYFPAVLLGVAIALPLSRSRRGFPIALVLYLAGLLGDSYFGLVRGVPVLSDIYEAMGYTRNGLFFAPLFLLLGRRLCPCAVGQALPGLCVSLCAHALRGAHASAAGLAEARQHVPYAALRHVFPVFAAAVCQGGGSGLVRRLFDARVCAAPMGHRTGARVRAFLRTVAASGRKQLGTLSRGLRGHGGGVGCAPPLLGHLKALRAI